MNPQRAPSCVACGAPAPAVLVPTTYECTFCHRSQVLQPPFPQAPPPGPQAPFPQGPFPQGPFPQGPFPQPPPFGGPVLMSPSPSVVAGAAGARVAFALVPLVIMVVVGISIAISSGGGGLGGPSRSGTGPGAGGVVPSGERMQWASSSRGGLMITDLNGDGIEDFVGHYRVLDMSTEHSTQSEYIGGFDGKTFERIWKTPSLGTLQQAISSTNFGIAAGRVVVADFRSQAHILDLKTGKELRLFALSDRAKTVCSPTDGKSEVWIELADQKNILFNVMTGAATLAPKPGWCAARQALTCSGRGFSGEPCSATSDESSAFYKLGISPDLVIRGDGRPVVLGNKTPGTPVSLLAAYDPKAMTITWQQTVAPDPASAGSLSEHPATFANGRIYTIYKTTAPEELHVTAFEASSGKRLLDFKVPRGEDGSGPEEIIVTAARIYVPHWTWLDVFDAKDGHHLETVGMW